MKFVKPLVVLSSVLGIFASKKAEPYVRVEFSDGQVIYYYSGECYPYQLDNGKGAIAEFAQWYQTTDCQSYSSFDCSGEKILNLPVPAGTPLVNAADFAQLLTGNSALCTVDPLPILG